MSLRQARALARSCRTSTRHREHEDQGNNHSGPCRTRTDCIERAQRRRCRLGLELLTRPAGVLLEVGARPLVLVVAAAIGLTIGLEVLMRFLGSLEVSMGASPSCRFAPPARKKAAALRRASESLTCLVLRGETPCPCSSGAAGRCRLDRSLGTPRATPVSSSPMF